MASAYHHSHPHEHCFIRGSTPRVDSQLFAIEATLRKPASSHVNAVIYYQPIILKSALSTYSRSLLISFQSSNNRQLGITAISVHDVESRSRDLDFSLPPGVKPTWKPTSSDMYRHVFGKTRSIGGEIPIDRW